MNRFLVRVNPASIAAPAGRFPYQFATGIVRADTLHAGPEEFVARIAVPVFPGIDGGSVGMFKSACL